MIKIIAVGRKHESWVTEGIDRYQKRLKKPYTIEWIILPHSSQDGLLARQNESESILKRLNASDFVILLDEIGRNLTTTDIAGRITSLLDISQSTVIVIGGAYGVDEKLKRRANLIWSLSNLVFPHQLVRLILVEQIYRIQEIAGGRSYHHE